MCGIKKTQLLKGKLVRHGHIRLLQLIPASSFLFMSWYTWPCKRDPAHDNITIVSLSTDFFQPWMSTRLKLTSCLWLIFIPQQWVEKLSYNLTYLTEKKNCIFLIHVCLSKTSAYMIHNEKLETSYLHFWLLHVKKCKCKQI